MLVVIGRTMAGGHARMEKRDLLEAVRETLQASTINSGIFFRIILHMQQWSKIALL